MKIRTGFVSNSSSCSFLIEGIQFKATKENKKLILRKFLGMAPEDKDVDEIFKQFKSYCRQWNWLCIDGSEHAKLKNDVIFGQIRERKEESFNDDSSISRQVFKDSDLFFLEDVSYRVDSQIELIELSVMDRGKYMDYRMVNTIMEIMELRKEVDKLHQDLSNVTIELESQRDNIALLFNELKDSSNKKAENVKVNLKEIDCFFFIPDLFHKLDDLPSKEVARYIAAILNENYEKVQSYFSNLTDLQSITLTAYFNSCLNFRQAINNTVNGLDKLSLFYLMVNIEDKEFSKLLKEQIKGV